MAQDVTTRVQVLGQNADGSLNVRMDGGNPFSTGGGAMQSIQQPGGAVGQYRARIGNVEVAFATEADMLKAQMALSQLGGSGSSTPQLLGGAAGGTGTGNWLGLASNAASAVNNVFARSALDRKVREYDRALASQAQNRERLQALQSKYPDLVPVLQDLFGSERQATETAQSTLEDLVNAQGIAIGVDVTRVAADFVNNSGSQGIFSGGSNAGPLLAGGAGLAVGLLASRSSNRDR